MPNVCLPGCPPHRLSGMTGWLTDWLARGVTCRQCTDKLAASKQSLANAKEMAKAAKVCWHATLTASAKLAKEIRRDVEALPPVTRPAFLQQYGAP